ncbi:MAG: zf-HC2 domain-containing protein [Gemmatimonadota bacterium]|nr:MAG: zf-HC2 domain-containing protein [Gemmatimonadota bacterium]
MRCAEFLQLYSEYRDGAICDPALEREIGIHLADCRKCMDYDAYISRGVMLLRATSDIAPSLRFTRRLERRLRDEVKSAQRGIRWPRIGAGVMAVLVAAAVITALSGRSSTSRQRPVGSPVEPAAARMEVAATSMRSLPAPRVARQAAGPPFVAATTAAGTVDLTDRSVPAFSRDVAAHRPQVSFAAWVSLRR